jgi:hypothetical protein
MSVFYNNALIGASGQGAGPGPGGYEIERSLRFNSGDSSFLSRTPSTAGNRKTWTWAAWVKLSNSGDCRLFGSYVASNNYANIEISNGNFRIRDVVSGSVQLNYQPDPLIRDYSAWYHLVVALDTTQANSSDRIKFYLNGEQIFRTGSTVNPSQNQDMRINTASEAHGIGGRATNGAEGFNGYLADIHFIDGQALDPTSFGEFDDNGIWQPIDASGLTYGTNGFHLDFADNSTAAALGTDTSGNGNTWTVNNISVTAGAGNDSLVDVPTNGTETDTGVGGEVRGNYCTLNPLFLPAGGTLSNGNLEATLQGTSSTNSRDWTTGTVINSSGKWYYEVVVNSYSGGTGEERIRPGIVNPSVIGTDFRFGTVLYRGEGSILDNNVEVDTGLPVLGIGDVVGIAYDLDSLNFYVYINGVLEGSAPISNVSPPFAPIVGNSDALNGTGVCTVNFGQRPFAYTAPSGGYKALCTANLPAPTIEDGSTVMDAVLYDGNGSTQTISGLNFSPDLVWLKCRSQSSDNSLQDTVRGAGNNRLRSNSIGAENTQSGQISSFNSDGWTMGNRTNESGETYVGWTWDAGSSTVSNTDGSITSSVRANPTAGFSIVTYTGNGSAGATVGHGLGIAPGLVVVKCRSDAAGWLVYHGSLGATKYLALESTAAAGTYSGAWNNTSPTSTVFSLGNDNSVNTSGRTYVAYCFAAVEGYSAFGSYTGNGSASGDGPFVFCNFRPRWILTKRTDSTNNWTIIDASRNSYNVSNSALFPNLSAQESTNAEYAFDILSNGFKVRGTPGDSVNVSGGTYVYIAFAESPFQYARAR